MTNSPPSYVPTCDEVSVCTSAIAAGRPVMIVGPTGCGKTRLVEHLAAQLDTPLRTIVGNDDTTTGDLLGRFLVIGGDVTWTDGPLTRAVRAGEICYIDEVVEVRREALAALHPVADDRRRVYLDRTGEVVDAAQGFALVCSYNPARAFGFKELRPAFRQRFVTIALDYLPQDEEAAVIVAETGIDPTVGARLAALGAALRQGGDERGGEGPSTRALVTAAHLVARGIDVDDAVRHCVIAPLVHGGGSPALALEEVLGSL